MNFELIKRTVIFRVIICVFVFLLAGRVSFITLVDGKQLSAKAESQNKLTLMINDNRGNFTDRNKKLITGVNFAEYAAIFPTSDSDTDYRVLSAISMYLDDDFYSLYDSLKNGRPVYSKLNKDVDRGVFNEFDNVKVILKKQRYRNDSAASSLIGYSSNGEGKAGLEFVYDNLLASRHTNNLSATVDALKRVIPGYSITASDDGSALYTVKTTIDLDYSCICREVLDKSGVSGAAVLLDTESFDVLAMESSPSFNAGNIDKYLELSSGNLVNRCVQEYDAGSIFKIVVAAAALEKGVVSPQDKFRCDGRCEVAGKEFVCHNESGHGEITFEEAFALSCNTVFIDIGLKTGYTEIIELAKKFGIGNKIINPLDFGQKSGKLPDTQNYYIADVANVSIGQGALSLTPVHGAVLSAVIASGGIIKPVNVTDSVINGVGNISTDVRISDEKRIISKETADIIYNMMITTSINGTGTTGYIEKFGSGGKTGSAQTGWYVNGERYQHGWYTGFFPAENPRYALCVFVENGRSGSVSAAPIFKSIGSQILNNYEVTGNWTEKN